MNQVKIKLFPLLILINFASMIFVQHSFSQTQFFTRGGDNFIFLQAKDKSGKIQFRMRIPNGGSFDDAQLFDPVKNEPYRVNANDWINEIYMTNNIAYVEKDIFLFPIMTSKFGLTLKESDMEAMNQKLFQRRLKPGDIFQMVPNTFKAENSYFKIVNTTNGPTVIVFQIINNDTEMRVFLSNKTR